MQSWGGTKRRERRGDQVKEKESNDLRGGRGKGRQKVRGRRGRDEKKIRPVL